MEIEKNILSTNCRKIWTLNQKKKSSRLIYAPILLSVSADRMTSIFSLIKVRDLWSGRSTIYH